MDVPFVDLKSQYLGIKPEVDAAIQSVLNSGEYIGGKSVQRFESSFASYTGVQHCIGVANGTDAILVALKSLGLSHNDEIVVPAFGWISASEMVTLAGGKPVFCDVLENGTLDPTKLEVKITPRTKGVIIVHLYGQAARAHEAKDICRRHNLFLIEDCAQAHLTIEHGKFVGTIGDVGTFSFYPTKNLGAYGDAGCVITNDTQLENKIRSFANHGGLGKHEIEGINSRLDPMQAAVLSVKLGHLQKWTDLRRERADYYRNLLKEIEHLTLPEIRPNATHTFHQFVVRTKHRDQLKNFLASKGIQTLIHYPVALHNMPAYAYMNFAESDFPQATQCQNEVLSLPIYPELTGKQIGYIADNIRSFFKTLS